MSVFAQWFLESFCSQWKTDFLSWGFELNLNWEHKAAKMRDEGQKEMVLLWLELLQV